MRPFVFVAIPVIPVGECPALNAISTGCEE
ncbi:hypothetical protein VCHENC02_5458B, partial [Vibrio harveyi]